MCRMCLSSFNTSTTSHFQDNNSSVRRNQTCRFIYWSFVIQSLCFYSCSDYFSSGQRLKQASCWRKAVVNALKSERYVINEAIVRPCPPPLRPHHLIPSLFTFANQLSACFPPHPNKWRVNPAGTDGWKWVLKGISKWHFNKGVCGEIMGPNESNVFSDVLTAWRSPSCNPSRPHGTSKRENRRAGS